MKSFSTTIQISTTAEVVWKILTNIQEWHQWNTTIDKIEGSIEPGAKVTVYAKVSPGRAFPLRVTELVTNKAMVWSGGIPLGLFTGERSYRLNYIDETTVEFTMNESFTGIIAPLITRSIPNLQPSFDEFAKCLKKHAESIVP